MCRLTSTLFHHVCTHTLTMQTPSLNPHCDIHKETFQYLPNKSCPKCAFWTSEFSDHEYDDWGPGESCGGYEGETSRNVRIGREQFGKEDEVARKWGRRREFLKKMEMEETMRVLREASKRAERQGNCQSDQRNLPDGGEVEGDILTPKPKEGTFDTQGNLMSCFCGKGDLSTTNGGESCEENRLVSLPCGDVFHFRCIQTELLTKKSNTCPTCSQELNIIRPKSPYAPPNFHQDMFEDLFAGEKWYHGLDWIGTMLDVTVVLVTTGFILSVPLWVSWAAMFVAFAAATWDKMGGGWEMLRMSWGSRDLVVDGKEYEV